MKTLFWLVVILILLFLIGCTARQRLSLEPDEGDLYEPARLILSTEEQEVFDNVPDAGENELNNNYDPAGKARRSFKAHVFVRVETSDTNFI